MASILVVFVSLSLFNALVSQRKFLFNTSSGSGGEFENIFSRWWPYRVFVTSPFEQICKAHYA